jgi:hypothetical protein
MRSALITVSVAAFVTLAMGTTVFAQEQPPPGTQAPAAYPEQPASPPASYQTQPVPTAQAPAAYPEQPASPPASYQTQPASPPVSYPTQPASPATPYPPPGQQPMYPQGPAYDPNLAAGQAMPRPHPIRQLFAGTLSAVLQGVSGGVVGAVTQGVTGSITNWFDRKRRPMPGMYPNAQYPGAAYPNPYPSTDPNAQYPTATTLYPTTQYPATQYPTGTTPYPGATPDPTAYGTQAYNPTTTSPTTTSPYATGTQPYSTGTTPYPTTGTTPGTTTNPYATTTAPYSTGATTYPNAAAGTQPYAGATTATGQATYDPYATQYYDPRTGQAVAPTATSYTPATTSPDQSALYAGVAYEVHAVLPTGGTTPINAATYEFHTGDRFVVHFRPSLPGRMEVYNVNPLGQQTRIDSVNMAAGQLTTLGPYQFAATTGDESLRLILSPCGNDSLYAQTRDIVNVSNTAVGGLPAVSTAPPTSLPPAAGTAPAIALPGVGAAPTAALTAGAPTTLALPNCGAPTTRSVSKVKTRDIQKVAVDGTTSFALDPVLRTELSSGQLAPREITIYFHHR